MMCENDNYDSIPSHYTEFENNIDTLDLPPCIQMFREHTHDPLSRMVDGVRTLLQSRS